MKNKKQMLLISGIAIFIIAAVVIALILIDPFKKEEANETNLSAIVGQNLTLKEATQYVYELDAKNMEDDFSRTMIGKITMKVVSVDEEKKTARVEFSVPDLEKIMTACLPSDTTGEYEEIFAAYRSSVIETIENADASQTITQTITCPVIEDDSGTRISIEGAPLFNFQSLLAEILLELAGEGEKK